MKLGQTSEGIKNRMIFVASNVESLIRKLCPDSSDSDSSISEEDWIIQKKRKRECSPDDDKPTDDKITDIILGDIIPWIVPASFLLRAWTSNVLNCPMNKMTWSFPRSNPLMQALKAKYMIRLSDSTT